MKYFIDFEALQFTEEIIAVGCINENGKEFYSLVQPKNIKKLTEFITNLTGITASDLENAPDAEEVFAEFFNWLDTSRNTTFLCYGNCDERFVERTLGKVKNFYAQCGLSLIKANLHDYSFNISRHFGTKQNIGLKRLVEYYRNEEVTQSHNALEDARFLKEITEKSLAEEPFAQCPFPEYAPKPKEDSDGKKKAKKQRANKKRYKVIAAKGRRIMKFRNMVTAANWVISSEMRNKAEYNEEVRTQIAKKIRTAAENETKYFDYSWRVFEDK